MVNPQSSSRGSFKLASGLQKPNPRKPNSFGSVLASWRKNWYPESQPGSQINFTIFGFLENKKDWHAKFYTEVNSIWLQFGISSEFGKTKLKIRIIITAFS